MQDVTLSSKSQALLTHLPSIKAQFPTEIVALRDVIAWLKDPSSGEPKEQFYRESLRASLLQDLLDSCFSSKKDLNPGTKNASRWRQLLFWGLAAAGTVVAVCQGFDGIVALLGLVTGLPVALFFVAGLFFSALSVAVFFAFDLVAISDNLGVEFSEAPKLLDVLIEQVALMKKLRKKIKHSLSAQPTAEEKQNPAEDLIAMMKTRLTALEQSRNAYLAALDRTDLQIIKKVITGITGILFFSSGFFAGQSLALMVAGLFVSSVVPMAAPIIIFSVLVGLAAVWVYWEVERPGYENLVGIWFGLDKEKIDEFTDEETVAEEQDALTALQKQVVQRETNPPHVSKHGLQQPFFSSRTRSASEGDVSSSWDHEVKAPTPA